MSAEPLFGTAAQVLVIDDDEKFLELVGLTLREAGYEPLLAVSGSAGLEAARTERPALVLLDVHLPLVSGYEVCRLLRDEFGAALPIIFLSGERKQTYDRIAGLLLGADDYVSKPFAPDELLARVRGLIRRTAATPTGRTASLTAREREVLQLLAQGLTQREISESLVIAPKTCGKHIERILDKLSVHSRAQAIAVAYREELVTAVR
ncbi:MAG TPA: DNA-binding response regulator [Gaiellaceae bacterium]|nr:DNA-binding response regulator [Gaiellaceae bacterium]